MTSPALVRTAIDRVAALQPGARGRRITATLAANLFVIDGGLALGVAKHRLAHDAAMARSKCGAPEYMPSRSARAPT